VKVLKKALQEERNLKLLMEKELKETHDKIDGLGNTLAEKVSSSFCFIFRQEKRYL
jgi:hypothetical protein